MKTFVVYNPVTGEVRAKYTISETQEEDQQRRSNEAVLKGEFNVKLDYIDTSGAKPVKMRKE